AESMDVCFITRGGRRSFLADRIPTREGTIVDTEGAPLGHHDGVASFTVGQRRGLGVAAGDPRYAVAVAARTAPVTPGERRGLLRDHVRVRDVSYVDAPVRARDDLHAQVRAHSEPVPAAFDGTTVHFATPQARVAPGQVVALYADDALVGGGIAT